MGSLSIVYLSTSRICVADKIFIISSKWVIQHSSCKYILKRTTVRKLHVDIYLIDVFRD